MGWMCSTDGVRRNKLESISANIIFIDKTGGKRPLRRHKLRLENIIKIDLKGICCKIVDWAQLIQDRDHWWALVDTVMNLRVLYKTGNFLTC
jgi:hypothetical protein